MLTYRTLDGDVLDLDGLSEVERAYLDRCVAAYQSGMDWVAFSQLVEGHENPLVRTAGVITAAAWDHPLFQAIRDMEDRLGIVQGQVEPEPGDDPHSDPFADVGRGARASFGG